MTAGTTGTMPPTAPLAMGVWTGKTWSGADGKYETYGPLSLQRLKWNDLTLSVRSRLVLQNEFVVKWVYPPNGNSGFVTEGPLLGQAANFTLFPIDSNLQHAVFQKLLKKIKNHEFNLGVDLGQMKQTVNLLSGNLSKLGLAALALKRGDFSRAARHLGTSPRGTRLKPSDISGRWLELQYGWIPLLQSSFEAAKAFEAISKGPRSILTVASRSFPVSYDLSQAPTRYSCIVTGKKRRRILFEQTEEMSVQRQLGLYDPLSIAWELTPWSFVVDWFIPIGVYLDNLNQIPTLQGRWLVTDSIKFEKTLMPVTWNQADPYGGGTVLAGVLKYPRLVVAETVLSRVHSNTPPPVPLPTFRFGLNSPRRFWNAVSLAHQRFLK